MQRAEYVCLTYTIKHTNRFGGTIKFRWTLYRRSQGEELYQLPDITLRIQLSVITVALFYVVK